MHAILKGQDEKLHWTEVADPTLREDDVLLEIHAAALNRADLLQRAGQYPPPPGWPEWYGLEAAGVIESYWGNENAGARRRYYHLTDEGRRLYEENREDWRKYRAVISQLIGLEEDEHDEQADSQHD